MCGGAEISPVGSLLQGWAFKKRCGGVCVAAWDPYRDETPSSLNSSLLGHWADVLRDQSPAPTSKSRR